MPDFWQFPTVSMGLGPIMAIYQARFMKYLAGPRHRRHRRAARSGRSSATARWTSRSRSARSRWPAREKLDNLIFVVNCNLQRLDGPVRGNGKIIQELESDLPRRRLERDQGDLGLALGPAARRATTTGLLRRSAWRRPSTASTRRTRRATAPTCASTSSAQYPELREMVADMTDEEIWALNRGGHDPHKVYAAYAAAVDAHGPADGDPRQDDQGLRDGRGRRGPEHHPPAEEDERGRAARVPRPLRARRSPTSRSATSAFYKPPDDCAGDGATCASAARRSAAACRRGARTARAAARCRSSTRVRARSSRARASARSRPRWRSCASSATLLRDKQIGQRVVPIVPDESRTFGMEGMFRQLGIFSQVGQLYQPEDADQLMFYSEDKHGQILQEGINEAGAISSWIAAGTSYANHGVHDDPVLHLLLDVRLPAGRRPRLGGRRHRARAASCSAAPRAARRSTARACSTRTATATCSASTIPNCVAYDPTYALRARGDHPGRPAADGRRAGGRLLLPHADERELPAPGDAGGRRGGDPARDVPAAARRRGRRPRVQLLGSGTILREVLAARRAARGATSASPPTSGASRASPSCAATGIEAERWNLLHPTEEPRRVLGRRSRSRAATGPVVAATDYMRAFADRSAPWVTAPLPRARHRRLRPQRLPRARCARFFEVDRHHVAVAALKRAGRRGRGRRRGGRAGDRAATSIDPERPAPWQV